MIEIRDLCGTLGEFTLRDINLDVNRGEYLVLLGPTGAGKTVLIEYIVGIHTQDSGSIMVRGADITPLRIEERNIAYVPQDYALFPGMTVAKNVAYGLEARRIPAGEVKRAVTAMMEKLGISHLRDRMPLHLSGGEKQRVALGRALVTGPDLVLLDEPLSALDENLRASMARDLRAMQRDAGATFIHVCHNFDEASEVADRIALMKDGELEQTGSLDEMKSAPKNEFVARFLNTCNIFPAVAGEFCVEAGGVRFHTASPVRGDAVMAVRPECIVLNGPASPSANIFTGTVKSVLSRPHFTAVTIDIGLTLVAYCMAGEFRQGDTVRLGMAPENIIVIQ